MIDDILTVIWKERKSQFRVRGSRMRFLLMLASPVLLATVFPITWGPDWLAQVPPLIIAALVSVILVAVMVPESIAGEREHHTLETLLASRLPDRAILLGKLIVPLAMGWGVAMLCLLLSLVVVNVAQWEGEILFYTPPIALGSLALSFLMATLTAGAGVFISLRTATAQEATQILTAAILIPPMLLQVLPLLFRDQMAQFIDSVNGPQLLVIILAVLAVADVVVLLGTVARFRRARLIVG
ncbi:MAG: ABC transporter permease [Anaerolineae bacterium]|nr:MAG: ABC transporter permease [Anaerolineae bacterium]